MLRDCKWLESIDDMVKQQNDLDTGNEASPGAKLSMVSDQDDKKQNELPVTITPKIEKDKVSFQM